MTFMHKALLADHMAILEAPSCLCAKWIDHNNDILV